MVDKAMREKGKDFVFEFPDTALLSPDDIGDDGLPG